MKLKSLNRIEKSTVSHNTAIQKQVILKNRELGNITHFSQAVLPSGEVATRHKHEDMGEVFLVQSGQGEITVNETTHKFEAGDCAVVEPGEYHEISNTGREALVLVYFGIEIIE